MNFSSSNLKELKRIILLEYIQTVKEWAEHQKRLTLNPNLKESKRIAMNKRFKATLKRMLANHIRLTKGMNI